MGFTVKEWVWVLLVLAVAVVGVPAGSQSSLTDQMTTQEHLAQPGWWPTRPASPSDKYIGREACSSCHRSITQSQVNSEMAQSLAPAANSPYLKSHYGVPFVVDGFTYQISETSGQPTYMIAKQTGNPKPLTWAFGSGKISQVYLTPAGDGFSESHFSFFESIPGFDTTPAQPSIRTATGDSRPVSTSAADGRVVPEREGRRCFSCHAARVPAQGPITDFLPGVTCEVCHGPGANHAAAEQSDLPGADALAFNPAHLRPVQQVDFCGACHATSIDVQLFGSTGPSSVRFPAYRLENSRCWRDDSRITCTACHDPHQALQHDPLAYDPKCLACHVASASSHTPEKPGKACPVSTSKCVTCHMPKYDFPDVHHKFTDHDIRVVRAGAPIPD